MVYWNPFMYKTAMANPYFVKFAMDKRADHSTKDLSNEINQVAPGFTYEGLIGQIIGSGLGGLAGYFATPYILPKSVFGGDLNTAYTGSAIGGLLGGAFGKDIGELIGGNLGKEDLLSNLLTLGVGGLSAYGAGKFNQILGVDNMRLHNQAYISRLLPTASYSLGTLAGYIPYLID